MRQHRLFTVLFPSVFDLLNARVSRIESRENWTPVQNRRLDWVGGGDWDACFALASRAFSFARVFKKAIVLAHSLTFARFALTSLAFFSFACVNREVVTSLPTSSRSFFFQSRDSLRRKGKGHGGKERHWTQDELGSHGKSLEESRTGITQGWAHNDEILEATRKAKLGEIFLFSTVRNKKQTRGVIFN